MRLGVMVEGQGGLTWERWRRIFHAAEDLGFESLWRSDHFFSFPSDPDDICIEAWTAITVAAAETQRIRFGNLISPITFLHPSVLAHMATSIDQLSAGRLEIGLGAGRHVPEHEQFGIPYPVPKERLDRLDEELRVLLALWGEGPASFTGKHYVIKEAMLLPKPRQKPHPPIVIGGRGQRSMRIAAKYADEWNVPPSMSFEVYRDEVQLMRQQCERVGRDPDSIVYSRATGFVVGRDEAELRHRLHAIQEEAPQFAKVDLVDLPAELVERGWVVGTPQQIVERLKAYEDAGCQRMMLQLHDQTDLSALELIAREVMPQVA